VRHLGAEVESEDAAVGEEEVIQRQEEGLAYDRIERSQSLRNLRPPARRTGARQPRKQRGGELPRRAQLGEPPRERSNPSKKPQESVPENTPTCRGEGGNWQGRVKLSERGR
jgi:hypothetical protein